MNITRLLYVGNRVLGYTEEEIFRMTPRKFYLLYDEHLYYHGKKKRGEDSMLDAL